MKTGLIGILNNPATSLNSHSAGMVRIVKDYFDADVLTERDDWDDYERLVIYHGPNFKPGSFNMIGGLSEEALLRAKKLANFNGSFFTFDGFQLRDFSIKRKLKLYDRFETIPSIKEPYRDSIVLGDSHSLSVWKPSLGIKRMDGKTLWGFLKSPLYPLNLSVSTLYFGNIDIRFHLCRQPDPIKATLDLVNRYIQYAKSITAKVVCLLPVESENRKLPGTGLYKGQPFYGSRKDRSDLVSLFNDRLRLSDLELHVWPQKWYEDIDYYQNEVMEPKQSVHIRPKHYANK